MSEAECNPCEIASKTNFVSDHANLHHQHLLRTWNPVLVMDATFGRHVRNAAIYMQSSFLLQAGPLLASQLESVVL